MGYKLTEIIRTLEVICELATKDFEESMTDFALIAIDRQDVDRLSVAIKILEERKEETE